MLTSHFYHKTLRKIVSAFGTMFNNIVVVRYDENMVETERLKVPLSYSQKEKFIYDLAYDSTLQKAVAVQLPRMSFELTGMQYDATRKLVSINKNFHNRGSGNISSGYNPVPYDFSFDLNIYTRTIEDASQIVEQIVPYFTPDYTVTISLVDENGMTINRDVPITLGPVIPQIDVPSDKDTPRTIIFTLQFTLKAYLFGPITDSGLIRKAITNIYDTTSDQQQYNFIMNSGGSGNYRYEEEVYAGENWANAKWTARVISWSNTSMRLDVYQVQGRATPNTGDVVFALDSGANWTLGSTNRVPLKHVKIVLEPSPNTAQPGDANIDSTVVITEFPFINE